MKAWGVWQASGSLVRVASLPVGRDVTALQVDGCHGRHERCECRDFASFKPETTRVGWAVIRLLNGLFAVVPSVRCLLWQPTSSDLAQQAARGAHTPEPRSHPLAALPMFLFALPLFMFQGFSSQPVFPSLPPLPLPSLM